MAPERPQSTVPKGLSYKAQMGLEDLFQKGKEITVVSRDAQFVGSVNPVPCCATSHAALEFLSCCQRNVPRVDHEKHTVSLSELGDPSNSMSVLLSYHQVNSEVWPLQGS